MRNKQLEYELALSRVRLNNRLDAIKLELFGRNASEIRNNLINYDIAQERVIDKACKNILDTMRKNAHN